MVRDRTRDLRRILDEREFSYGMTLEALVTALDARERDTTRHSLRVAIYTATLARAMGIPEPDLIHVYRGSLLHDVGKIGIPDAILLKPGKLTPEEWDIMRTHPTIGSRILEGISFLEPAREIVLRHHERWDGTGYPDGLKADAIPLFGRIVGVADFLDAMTSARSYRPAEPLERALERLREGAGSHFDPAIVRAVLALYERGELVEIAGS
jgi:putative nucleotidyltransferase with HDIG domain